MVIPEAATCDTIGAHGVAEPCGLHSARGPMAVLFPAGHLQLVGCTDQGRRGKWHAHACHWFGFVVCAVGVAKIE